MEMEQCVQHTQSRTRLKRAGRRVWTRGRSRSRSRNRRGDEAGAGAGMEEEMSENTALSSVLNEMRIEGEMCDVVLKVGQVEFQAHKNILSVYSPFFRSLFSRWSSEDQREYHITTVPQNIMGHIINYIYTKELVLSIDDALDLLDSAQYLLMQSLFCNCCKFLEDSLSPDNCLEIWQHADARSYDKLSKRAFDYVLHHFEDVVQSPSGSLLELSAEQLGNILEKDTLNIEQEKTAFEVLISWIQHDPDTRMKNLADLLKKVRLALMPPEYFLEHVERNRLLNSVRECEIFLTQSMLLLYRNNMIYKLWPPCTLKRYRFPYSLLFATSGFRGLTPTNVIEIYDSRMDRWRYISNTEIRSRAYHGTVFLGEFMYLIGGYNRLEYFNTMSKFNPRDGTWSEGAPMHSRRCYVSVVLLDDYIYAIGGFNGIVRLSTAERYNPNTNQWSLIASMHEQRSDANATSLQGKIYICGGFNGIECLATVECYSPEYNQWTLISPMHLPRSGVGVVTFDNQVLAAGGFDGNNRLQSVEVYNPQTNSWRILTFMFNPRSNFGIEVMGSCLYVIGGFDGVDTTTNCECYDFNSDTWYTVRDMTFSRSALSCCVISGLSNVAEYTFPRDDSGPH
ncbi:kelch-like protein 10 isoform X1 [Silurus meridionalis]|uniref:kelch-like protein 10 isoform X1 n=1 Tax=Silurus meridionalis TaxID=175797 RepID=UPI001EEACE01|nr:kelch-like protein 10 isoform X1 [Silurus meridionalis]